MEEKEFQFLFSADINGNSLIQLENGKILFYHFQYNSNIYIYDEKTFKKLFEIDLIDLVNKYEEEKRKDEKSNDDVEEEEEKNIRRYFYSRNKVSVKEINDGIILIGFIKYIFELKKNNQTYNCKIINKITDDILELNLLTNKNIIIITDKNIYILYKKNNEYIIKEEYLIKDDWKSVTEENPIHYYGNHYEYFSSYILPNNRLLLNSYAEGNCRRRCGKAPRIKFKVSKFTFINLTNFEEIFSSEIFNSLAKYIIIKNNIIIQVDNNFGIYDINTLKIVKKIYLPQIYSNIEKIYEDNLIAFSNDEKEKKIIIYTIENNDLIEKFKVKGNLVFKTKYNKVYNKSELELYDNKYLLALKDKRIIIICGYWIYVVRINDN